MAMSVAAPYEYFKKRSITNVLNFEAVDLVFKMTAKVLAISVN
jgi:hypothetical protein